MKIVLNEHFSRRSAARWFARLRSGAVSGSTDSAFRHWLDRDPTHERELERSELLWSLLGDLEHDPEVIAWTKGASTQSHRQGDNLTGIHTAEFVKTSRPRSTGRSVVSRQVLTAATAAALLVAATLWMALPFHPLIPSTAALRPIERIYTTAVGEHRRITLSDGSSAELNTATRLRVRYTERERHIDVDTGEALFLVRHDMSRPFEVAVGDIVTRDVGTVFNVLSLNDRTQIAVLEGRVQVTALPPGPRETSRALSTLQPMVQLGAGQGTTYTHAAGLGAITNADLERIQSWRSGRVEFRDIPLSVALSDFNRYTTNHIVLDDPTLGSIRVSGVFHAGDVNAFVHALHSSFHIAARVGPSGEMILHRQTSGVPSD